MTTSDFTWRPVPWKIVYEPVSSKDEHIRLSCNGVEDTVGGLIPLARIAPTGDATLAFEWLFEKRSKSLEPKVLGVVRWLFQELGERDPWGYATYHCSTAANLYMEVHCSFFPADGKLNLYAHESSELPSTSDLNPGRPGRNAERYFDVGVEGGGEILYRVRWPGKKPEFVLGGRAMRLTETDEEAWSSFERRYADFDEYFDGHFLQRDWWPAFYPAYIHEEIKDRVMWVVLAQAFHDARRTDDPGFPMSGETLRTWLAAVDYAERRRPVIPRTLRIDFTALAGRVRFRTLDLDMQELDTVQDVLDVIYSTALHPVVPARSYDEAWTLVNLQTGERLKKSDDDIELAVSAQDVLWLELRDE